jgi:hypothetical protein
MTQPLIALLAALPCAILAVAPAGAATRQFTAAGKAFAVDSPCARQVTITPDGQAGAGITVNATADNQEELDRLQLTNDATPKLTVPQSFASRCWRPAFSVMFKPTLVLDIHIPPGSPLSIDESGEGDYSVGDIDAPLAADLSGAAQVKAGNVGAFGLEVSGSADVSVARADGPLQAELSGNGALDLATVTASTASLELSGRGSVKIGHGSIGKLSLSGSGVADVNIGATVGDASIDISGVGSVRIAKVTGNLQKDISGMATVDIGK